MNSPIPRFCTTRLIRGLSLYFLLGAILFPTLLASGTPAQNCAEKLRQLKAHQVQTPMVLTESELNSFFQSNQNLISFGMIQRLQVNLLRERIHYQARVNLSRLKRDNLPFAMKMFLWVFSGEHDLEAQVYIQSFNGKGHYKFESLSIDGISLPGFMTDFVTTEAIRLINPSKAPNVWFPMPYALEKCWVEPGRAICYPQGWKQNAAQKQQQAAEPTVQPPAKSGKKSRRGR